MSERAADKTAAAIEAALNDPRLERPRAEEDPELAAFIQAFKTRFGPNLAGVVLLGSYLSSVMRTETSFRDFFVLVDTYAETGGPLERLLHRVLPPDLYHLAVELDGRKVDCKFYLLTLEELSRLTGENAPDLYVLGRFSKRMEVVYARDDKSRAEVLKAQAQAVRRAVRLAACILEEPVDEDDFIKHVLRLSYLAETRLEDERKIESLFRGGEPYYRKVYLAAAEPLLEEGLLVREGNRFKPGPAWTEEQSREVWRFIEKSRRRAKLRWPKMILTVDNWMDQLLLKLERTHGIKLEIPRWERKIILITGWRHYFRLKKKGKIR